MTGLPFVPIVAHAFGKRYDLPVPLWLFVVGGAMVVFFSFLLVLPRAVRPSTPGEATLTDSVTLHTPAPARWAIAGLVLLGLVCAGLVGSQSVAENILPTFFWLLIWVAVPISCGIIGDWTRAVNPFAALARAADRPGLRRRLLTSPEVVRWPGRLGWWPAVVLFFTVACGELIYNADATKPGITALGLLLYALLSTLAGLFYGAPAWLERGELFSVLFSTWGRLGWFRFGTAGQRRLGGGLAVPFATDASRITFVLMLLVSVSFDGLLATPASKQLRASVSLSGVGFELVQTAAFAALVIVAWVLFGGFAALVRWAGRLERTNLQVLAGLLPSLLPIAFGYLLAHNAEYLAINGQLLIPLLGNPAGVAGMRLLPPPFTDSYEINANLLPSSVTWYCQVVLIVAVHIAAVMLAHRYLGRAAGVPAAARRSEWPWIVAMVGYTVTSLWLLAQPLVEASATAPRGAGLVGLAVLLR